MLPSDHGRCDLLRARSVRLRSRSEPGLVSVDRAMGILGLNQPPKTARLQSILSKHVCRVQPSWLSLMAECILLVKESSSISVCGYRRNRVPGRVWTWSVAGETLALAPGELPTRLLLELPLDAASGLVAVADSLFGARCSGSAIRAQRLEIYCLPCTV